MSWLRIDDGFANHPKIAKLTDREFRVWLRTLCYCARYQDPSVDDATLAEVKGLEVAKIARFAEIGLLDSIGEAYEVHDWQTYTAKDLTGTERQAKWRARRAKSNGRVTEKVTHE